MHLHVAGHLVTGWPAVGRTMGSILGRGASAGATGILQSIERGRDVETTLRYPRRGSSGSVLEVLDTASTTGGTTGSVSLSVPNPGVWDLALRCDAVSVSGGSTGDTVTDWPRYIWITGPGELEDSRGIPLRAADHPPFVIGPGPVLVTGSTISVDIVAYAAEDPTSFSITLTLRGAPRT